MLPKKKTFWQTVLVFISTIQTLRKSFNRSTKLKTAWPKWLQKKKKKKTQKWMLTKEALRSLDGLKMHHFLFPGVGVGGTKIFVFRHPVT